MLNIILFNAFNLVESLLFYCKINAKKLITRSEKRFLAKMIIKLSLDKSDYRKEYRYTNIYFSNNIGE